MSEQCPGARIQYPASGSPDIGVMSGPPLFGTETWSLSDPITVGRVVQTSPPPVAQRAQVGTPPTLPFADPRRALRGQAGLIQLLGTSRR